MVVAMLLDATVARRLHDSGFAESADALRWKWLLKAPGEAWLVAIVAVAVTPLHPWKLLAGAWIALAGALSGLQVVIKWVVGRTRPYEIVGLLEQPRPFLLFWFRDGGEGFLHQKNLSFPSGHTSTAFALAAALGVLFPRGRWLFYSVATLTGLQRISENAHYVSDVVAAAGFGVGVTYAALWCINTLQLRAAARKPPLVAEATP
jgi:membrane-associated phospholipid phosphatase